jgi:hypothetical protein
MNNRNRAAAVAELVHQFAKTNTSPTATPEAIASGLIRDILHWTMRESEMAGDDGRKTALAAARSGLSWFIEDVHRTPGSAHLPSCYTLITVRTNEGLWVAETGHEEIVR